jgi:hypothetical protein
MDTLPPPAFSQILQNEELMAKFLIPNGLFSNSSFQSSCVMEHRRVGHPGPEDQVIQSGREERIAFPIVRQKSGIPRSGGGENLGCVFAGFETGAGSSKFDNSRERWRDARARSDLAPLNFSGSIA